MDASFLAQLGGQPGLKPQAKGGSCCSHSPSENTAIAIGPFQGQQRPRIEDPGEEGRETKGMDGKDAVKGVQVSLHRPGAGPLCWAVAITWASSLVTSSCGDTSWPRRYLPSGCLSQKHSPLLVPPACQVLWGTQAGAGPRPHLGHSPSASRLWWVRSHGWEGLSCDSISCKQPQTEL